MSERLGRYHLDRRIALGGMAEVFLAREELPDGSTRVCVVKRAYPHLCADPHFARMFLSEAQLAAQLDHPNIARIFDLGAMEDSYFLAMEYVPGNDLLAIIRGHAARGQQIAQRLAARIGAQAASALHCAHTALGRDGQPLMIVHRDVSPQNILLSTEGVVKLIDFGVAKAANALHRTRTGTLKGKIHYMSPEQAGGDPVDHRADIYSLGLVLYELLTGKRAIGGATELETIENAMYGRLPPLESLRPDVEAELRMVLARALELSAGRRYGSAAELERALESFLERHPQVGPSDLEALHRFAIPPDAKREGTPTPSQTPDGGLDPTLIREPAGRPAGVPEDTEPGRVPIFTPVEVPHSWPADTALSRTGGRASAAETLPPDGDAIDWSNVDTLPPGVVTPPAGGAARPAASARGPGWNLTGRPGAALERPTERGLPAFRRTGEDLPAAVRAIPAEPAKRQRSSARVWLAAVALGAALAGASVFGYWAVRMEQRSPSKATGASPVPDWLELATLRVRSTPPLEVWINGQPHGKSPLELALPAGSYDLELRDDRLGLRRQQRVDLDPGAVRLEEWQPGRGQLVVVVRPLGELFVDGKSQGVIARRRLELWEGRHRIRVVDRGKAAEREAEVLPGGREKISFDLRP
ncbi:MAG: serine/threonine protein kinase [Myxococcales bacterium]|nr:serine/threonine protein kinase [Myxococcales bacterium]